MSDDPKQGPSKTGDPNYDNFQHQMKEVIDNLRALKGDNYADMTLALAELLAFVTKGAGSPQAMMIGAFIAAHVTKVAAVLLNTTPALLSSDVTMVDGLANGIVEKIKRGG